MRRTVSFHKPQMFIEKQTENDKFFPERNFKTDYVTVFTHVPTLMTLNTFRRPVMLLLM